MGDFYSAAPEEQADRIKSMAAEALTAWSGTYSELKLVKHRENSVFSAVRGDGVKVALRVHRPGYHSIDALHSELCWMQALGRDGLEVPEVICTASGATLLTASHPAVPEPRHMDMLKWLGGEPSGAVKEGTACLLVEPVTLARGAGELAARLHRHASAWVPPAGFTRPAWDLEGLLGSQPLWGRFWELPALSAEQATLIRLARDRARIELAALQPSSMNYGLIHADFSPENLLWDGERLKLIDFDDCGFGWYMFELATPLFLQLGAPSYADAKAALIAGYRSVRELSDADLHRLPLFLLLRGFTYLGWVQTRAETAAATEHLPGLVRCCCALAQAYLAER